MKCLLGKKNPLKIIKQLSTFVMMVQLQQCIFVGRSSKVVEI